MEPTSLRAKLMAASLLLLSACGTFAVFGCVPLLARLTSPPSFPHPSAEYRVVRKPVSDSLLSQ